MSQKRTTHAPAFKAKVALAAIREDASVAALSKKFGVHANQIYKWKQEFLTHAARAFEPAASGTRGDEGAREGELLKKIGELTVERDFLERGFGRLG